MSQLNLPQEWTGSGRAYAGAGRSRPESVLGGTLGAQNHNR